MMPGPDQAEPRPAWHFGRAPSYQFYPADWLTDAALQSCGLFARGLWHEMLCRMWSCEPQGHLLLNGRPYSVAQLARLVRESERHVASALEELRVAGVFAETADGVIYSRRMLRDLNNRAIRAEGGMSGAAHGWKGGIHGAKGGRPRRDGTPAKGGKKIPPQNPPCDPEKPENKTPSEPSLSSSSSSSSSVIAKAIPLSARGISGMSDFERREIDAVPEAWSDDLAAVWLRWIRHLTELLRTRPSTETLRKHHQVLRPLASDADRMAWLETAMARGFRAPAPPLAGAKKTEAQRAPITQEDHANAWR